MQVYMDPHISPLQQFVQHVCPSVAQGGVMGGVREGAPVNGCCGGTMESTVIEPGGIGPKDVGMTSDAPTLIPKTAPNTEIIAKRTGVNRISGNGIPFWL